MPIIRWDPRVNLVAIQERMNRLFDESLHRSQSCGALESGTWMPPIDIYETEKEIVITAELPGMTEEDVLVELRDDVLSLKGERKMVEDLKKESYHRVERAYGCFNRSFTLPREINQEGISARFENGVIEVRMPKTQTGQPQRIKIEKL